MDKWRYARKAKDPKQHVIWEMGDGDVRVCMPSKRADAGNIGWSKTWVGRTVAPSEGHRRPQHFRPLSLASCCQEEVWNNHNDPDTCTIISKRIYAYKQ
jgi:hypothetical protein